jgi:peptidylprolyl isomerase
MKLIVKGVPLLVIALAIAACAPAKVADKKMVSFDYTGTLTDGTVFSQSEAGQPLEFLVGSGTIIPTLETALMGMKVGETKTVTVKAADAYGEYDEAAIQDVPKEQFPSDLSLVAGQQYQVQTGTGTMIVTIKEVKEKTVSVDFNHPMAGKDLTFAVKIVKIRDATKEELAAAQTSSTAAEQ